MYLQLRPISTMSLNAFESDFIKITVFAAYEPEV